MSVSDPHNPLQNQVQNLPASGAMESVADQHLSDIGSLMSNLDEAPSEAWSTHQNRLVEVRLGIASALFWALRVRHQPTADHSLRVALSCSHWAASLDVGSKAQDEIEVAALFTRLGKIGVPDSILRSPRPLSADEAAVMSETRKLGKHIMSSCCSNELILEIVGNVPAWYDGSRPGFVQSGEEIPLGARMISIADAYDSMTTEHVFRPARTRERALAELYSCAGTQFDPVLVEDFVALQTNRPVEANEAVLRGWLRDLSSEDANQPWSAQERSEFARSQHRSTVPQFARRLHAQRRYLRSTRPLHLTMEPRCRTLDQYSWRKA